MKPKRIYLVSTAVLLGCLSIYLAARSQNTVLIRLGIRQSEAEFHSLPEPDIKTAPANQHPPPKPGPIQSDVPGRIHSNEGSIARYLSFFTTPISFYGNVIDEKGNPVEGADVQFSAADQTNPYGKNSQYSGTSDKRGLFSISGIHGAKLYVAVSKDGYYRTPEFDGHRGSSDGFPYDGVRGNSDPPIPTPNEPATFVLRKRGRAASLVQVLEGPVMLPKDGSTVKISLQTGEASPRGELTVQSWTQDQTRDTQGRYPWLCQLSVPGGGLTKRSDEFAFEAPSEGYQTFDEIAPPSDRWSSQAERQYFVKTADDHFARITVRMHASGTHFVTIGSYYNPTPGDRNLEYDPKLAVKIP